MAKRNAKKSAEKLTFTGAVNAGVAVRRKLDQYHGHKGQSLRFTFNYQAGIESGRRQLRSSMTPEYHANPLDSIVVDIVLYEMKKAHFYSLSSKPEPIGTAHYSGAVSSEGFEEGLTGAISSVFTGMMDADMLAAVYGSAYQTFSQRHGLVTNYWAGHKEGIRAGNPDWANMSDAELLHQHLRAAPAKKG